VTADRKRLRDPCSHRAATCQKHFHFLSLSISVKKYVEHAYYLS